MVETPVRGHHNPAASDAVSLCLILAMLIAFIPWSKVFADEIQVSYATTEDVVSPDALSSQMGPVHEKPRDIRYDSATEKYARSYNRRPRNPKSLTDDLSARLEGSRLGASIASRVVDMPHGTALRMWQVSDQWSINAYDPRNGDAGIKLSFQR